MGKSDSPGRTYNKCDRTKSPSSHADGCATPRWEGSGNRLQDDSYIRFRRKSCRVPADDGAYAPNPRSPGFDRQPGCRRCRLWRGTLSTVAGGEAAGAAGRATRAGTSRIFDRVYTSGKRPAPPFSVASTAVLQNVNRVLRASLNMAIPKPVPRLMLQTDRRRGR